MTEDKALSDYYWNTREGFDKRAAELAAALKGEPAAAIRKFLDDQGFGFSEARMHSGDRGSSVWAVGSHANAAPGDKDVTVEFAPNAISLAHLLAVVLHATRLPQDADYGRPEGFRRPDGSINMALLRENPEKPAK